MTAEPDLSEPKLQLFAKARRIYPKDITGHFRNLKWTVMGMLLAIYYFTPFIRWDRGMHAPNQAVLIEMERSRAYFFGIEIWAKEVYYLSGMLILAAIGLFFVTSLLGRVWCGYACPQTVWTDLFVKVEQWIQGDHIARQRLDKAPLSFEKIWKKTATHLLWIVIGLCTGGAWTLYFTDAPTLIDNIIHFSVPWDTAFWIYGLTFSTYIMAGFAREQVCTYMCPYARFQSGMFDKDTLIITYDAQRGEPRGSHKKGDSWDNRGACVDCKACVQVCPVGIDIRNGLQYQCIACGLCVDACNDIMDKVDLPRDLIRYDTATNQEARDACRNAGKSFTPAFKLLRPRSIYYALVIALVGGIMLYTLLNRSPYELNVLHERNPLFVKLSDGSVRNTYKIHIANRAYHDQHFALSVDGIDSSALKVIAAQEVQPEDLTVLADNVGEFRITLAAKAEANKTRREIAFTIKNLETHNSVTTKTMFITGSD